MKKIMFFLLFTTLSFLAFGHESQKQTEEIMPEKLTQKWLECEAAGEDEYKDSLEAFYKEVKKLSPSDTLIYYFPEAKVIYENLLDGIKENDRQKMFTAGKYCRKAL